MEQRAGGMRHLCASLFETRDRINKEGRQNKRRESNFAPTRTTRSTTVVTWALQTQCSRVCCQVRQPMCTRELVIGGEFVCVCATIEEVRMDDGCCHYCQSVSLFIVRQFPHRPSTICSLTYCWGIEEQTHFPHFVVNRLQDRRQTATMMMLQTIFPFDVTTPPECCYFPSFSFWSFHQGSLALTSNL